MFTPENPPSQSAKLVECVEERKWTFPQIAVCLVKQALRRSAEHKPMIVRQMLLDDMRTDYERLRG